MLLGSLVSSSKERPSPRHKPRPRGAEFNSLPCCDRVDWGGEGGRICEAERPLGFIVWSEEGEGEMESGQPGHVQGRC